MIQFLSNALIVLLPITDLGAPISTQNPGYLSMFVFERKVFDVSKRIMRGFAVVAYCTSKILPWVAASMFDWNVSDSSAWYSDSWNLTSAFSSVTSPRRYEFLAQGRFSFIRYGLLL